MSIPDLKSISEQAVVVVGASSGMGRLTALRFAQRGARVAILSRNEPALQTLIEEIHAAGGHAVAFTADVADFQQLKTAVDTAAEQLNGIDTFVNFAGTAVYAPFQELTPEEFRRIIDVNLNGQAYGAMAALPHLRKNGRGALIAISSVEGFLAMPYHSAYAASKHGLNGMIEALRMELDHEGSGVSVTGIMPTGVNTPFFSNARTKLGVKPRPPEPIYAPEHVADAVLFAAENRVHELFVGGASKMFEVGKRIAPHCIEGYVRSQMFEAQRTKEPKGSEAASNLFKPETGDARIHGDYSALMKPRSSYVWLQTHPDVCFALKMAAYVGLVALLLAPAARRKAMPKSWWEQLTEAF